MTSSFNYFFKTDDGCLESIDPSVPIMVNKEGEYQRHTTEEKNTKITAHKTPHRKKNHQEQDGSQLRGNETWVFFVSIRLFIL